MIAFIKKHVKHICFFMLLLSITIFLWFSVMQFIYIWVPFSQYVYLITVVIFLLMHDALIYLNRDRKEMIFTLPISFFCFTVFIIGTLISRSFTVIPVIILFSISLWILSTKNKKLCLANTAFNKVIKFMFAVSIFLVIVIYGLFFHNNPVRSSWSVIEVSRNNNTVYYISPRMSAGFDYRVHTISRTFTIWRLGRFYFSSRYGSIG